MNIQKGWTFLQCDLNHFRVSFGALSAHIYLNLGNVIPWLADTSTTWAGMLLMLEETEMLF